MTELTISESGKRKLRLLLVLPVLVVPFLTVTFWLLDGGKAEQSALKKVSGLNMHLPDARVAKDSAKDKLTFYQQAEEDSSKKQEQLRRDPYAISKIPARAIDADQSESQPIETKIASIRKRIAVSNFDKAPSFENTTQVKGLTQTEPVSKSTHEADPEMEAINQTLDKLMALQHPKANSDNRKVASSEALKVMAADQSNESYFGRKDTTRTSNLFYSEGESLKTFNSTLFAIIPTTQVLNSGSVIRLQLVQSISIREKKLPSGSLVYGTVSLENERLMVTIPSVRIEGEVLPVSLSVYDMDGLEGIYVPGSISRDITKSSADNALQSVNVLSLDPSIKTQAAMAGIGAVKSLLSKKVRLVRATISAGYKVLLKNNKIQDHE